MTISFDKVAQRIFQILKSRGYGLKMYQENGQRAFDPSLEARKFFVEDEGIMVAINRSGDDSEIKVYISQDSSLDKLGSLLVSLRQTANFFGLLYNVRKYGKNLKPKEFAFLAYRAQREEEEEMNESVTVIFKEIAKIIDSLLEARLTPKQIHEQLDKLDLRGLKGPMKFKVEEYIQEGYKNITEAKDTSSLWGTSQSSYQRVGSKQARLVVRHSQPVDEDKFAARSRHISKIFIENADGERIKFPVNFLQGARAMTRHVSMGGNFNDAIGEHIQHISEEYDILRTFKRHAGRKLHEQASSVIGLVRTRGRDIVAEVKGMQGPKSYKRYVENFKVSEEALEEDIVMLEARRIKKIFDSIASYDGIDEAFIAVARLSRMNERFDDIALMIESGEISFMPKREMSRGHSNRSSAMIHKLYDLAERASDIRVSGFISRIAEKISNEIPMERSELDLVKGLVQIAENSSTAMVEALDNFANWADNYVIEGSKYLDRPLRSEEEARRDIEKEKEKKRFGKLRKSKDFGKDPFGKKKEKEVQEQGDDWDEPQGEDRLGPDHEEYFHPEGGQYGWRSGDKSSYSDDPKVPYSVRSGLNYFITDGEDVLEWEEVGLWEPPMDQDEMYGIWDEWTELVNANGPDAPTLNPHELEEKAPKGWEGTVKAMKKHKDEIDNPWALAHYMKGKGYKSHKTKSGKDKRESIDLDKRSTESLREELGQMNTKDDQYRKLEKELYDRSINETAENIIRFQELAGISKKKIIEADPYGGSMISPYGDEPSDADINRAYDEAEYFIRTELVDEVDPDSMTDLRYETEKYLEMIGLGSIVSNETISEIINKVYPATELDDLKTDLAKDPILKTQFGDEPKEIITRYQKRGKREK